MTTLRYERPATVAQATALLAGAPGRAAVLAGGTDLAIRIRDGKVSMSPEMLLMSDIHSSQGHARMPHVSQNR